MHLQSISYSEFDGKPREWILRDSEFGKITLIVGRNTSGKTRTLNIISGLADLISGEREALTSGNYHVKFISGKDQYVFDVNMADNVITSETFTVNDVVKLQRNSEGKGKVYAKQYTEDMDFMVSQNKLASVVRRDPLQHEFLEPLHEWAKGYIHYRFADDEEKATLLAFGEGPSNKKVRYHPTGLLKKGLEKFEDQFKNNIILDLKSVGYSITDLGIKQPYDVLVTQGPPVHGVYVQEEDLDCYTEQRQMSSGMFRALSVIIKLNYMILDDDVSKPVLSVDDIGEGLDYQRSSDLVSLLINKTNSENIQLIMSTNDQFVMNGVSLDYWSISNRNGNIVNIINKKSAPDLFEKFKYIGLNNFEFFASDFFLG
jgi:ABC-type lipoprotein export system ATPase subunit